MKKTKMIGLVSVMVIGSLAGGCTYSRSVGEKMGSKFDVTEAASESSSSEFERNTVTPEGEMSEGEVIVPEAPTAGTGEVAASPTAPAEAPSLGSDPSPAPETPVAEAPAPSSPEVTVPGSPVLDTTPPTVVSVSIKSTYDAAGFENVRFEIVFSEPVNFYALIANRSIVFWNLAYPGTPSDIYIPGGISRDNDGPSATTVYFYPTEPLKVLRRSIDGRVMPYNLTVFGDLQDMAGNLMEDESIITTFECGTGEGKIACIDDSAEPTSHSAYRREESLFEGRDDREEETVFVETEEVDSATAADKKTPTILSVTWDADHNITVTFSEQVLFWYNSMYLESTDIEKGGVIGGFLTAGRTGNEIVFRPDTKLLAYRDSEGRQAPYKLTVRGDDDGGSTAVMDKDFNRMEKDYVQLLECGEGADQISCVDDPSKMPATSVSFSTR